MNKIMQKLLEVTYPSIDIQSLMEIVGNTPNPELATEMLCGLYTEPKIEHKRVKSSGSEGVLTFISYDKWNDKVNYSYMAKETKGAYFPKGTKQEDVNMENFDKLKLSNSGNETTYLYIPTGKESKKESYISLESWLKLPYEPSEGEKKQLEQENIFAQEA